MFNRYLALRWRHIGISTLYHFESSLQYNYFTYLGRDGRSNRNSSVIYGVYKMYINML